MIPLQQLLRAPARRAALAATLALLLAPPARAQAAPEPRREQLLNGLRVLLVERPGESQAALRLRVHSGAAFDLAGKEGTFALLGDSLFPDPNTRDYVTGDLQGRLEVSTGYDSVDVLLTGRAEEFERLVELLRNAVVNHRVSPEVFGRLRDARLKTVRDLGVSPETTADRAAAARLFAPFPYGRPAHGTPESLARIEAGDLILARERFLNPDNATLVVTTGGVAQARALRAIRQFLGPWRKSDQTVPPTFRQPGPVDARTLVLDLPGAPDAQLRVVARGLSRRDPDSAAALALAELARERWVASAPELKGHAVGVRHSSYALGGLFQMSAAVPPSAAARALDSARKVIESLVRTPPNASELEGAKSAALSALEKAAGQTNRQAEVWLDEHTYGGNAATLPAVTRTLAALTPADVQRVARRLFATPAPGSNASVAAVAVGDAAVLRGELARVGDVEVFDPNAPPPQAPKPAAALPLKAPTRRRP